MASPMQVGDPPRRPLLLTTVLANNIHCSSCVSHIEEVISQSAFSHEVWSTNVSVVSGEIQILHDAALPVKLICREISEAAFEVHAASTIDETDKVVCELAFAHGSDGILEDATERLRNSIQKSPPLSPGCWGLSSPTRIKRKRHVENCSACQSKEKEQTSWPPTPCNEKSGIEVQQISFPTQFSTTPKGPLPQSPKDIETRPTNEVVLGLQEPHDATTQEWRCELSISGMTCSACTNSVHDGLAGLEGVKSIAVNLMSNSATVIFMGAVDHAHNIVSAVEDLGFDATLYNVVAETKPSLKTHGSLGRSSASTLKPPATSNQVSQDTADTLLEVTLSIGGMTCAACTNAATDCLQGLPFVDDATVTLMTNSAKVLFRGKNNLEALVEAIEDVGFDCSVEGRVVPIKSASAPGETSNNASVRSLQIKIDGFHCPRCPSNVMDRLCGQFADSVSIIQEPTLAQPVVGISYTPNAHKGLNIRKILLEIEELDDQRRLVPSVYHPPSLEERSRQVQAHERNKLLLRLIFSFIVVIPTFVIGVVFMDLVPSTNPTTQYFMHPIWAGQVPRSQWALFILATPVYFFAADIFHLRAAKEIRALWSPRSRAPILRRLTKFGSMNLLVSAGNTVAYVSSLALLIMAAVSETPASSPVSTYFDTVVFLTFFILIGRWLEAFSKSKAGDAVSMLGNLRPENAILSPMSGEEQIIASDLLEIGDHVLVRHGESPPADGVLIDANASFDESSLTGESRPVRKASGDKVFTGTINVGNPVKVKVTDISGTSMLDQIITVVREGQVQRAPVEAIADLITGYFVPVITALAMITFITWAALGNSGALNPAYLQGTEGGWTFWSLEFAIAVFVVACPCGIGLAAPTALFVGGGLAAKHGILARGGGQAFQDAGKLDAIIFDKTGTLTEGGDLKVTNLEILSPEERQPTAMAIVHALESASSHPIAAAIAQAAKVQVESAVAKGDWPELQTLSIEEIPGRGLQGTFQTSEGRWEAKIGSGKFTIDTEHVSNVDNSIRNKVAGLESETKTVAYFLTKKLALDEKASSSWALSSVFAVEDAIRDSAKPAIAALRARGLEVYMLSGDNPSTARAVASRVGIDLNNVFAGVLPTEKAEKVEWLRNNLEPSIISRGPGGFKRMLMDQGLWRTPAFGQARPDLERQAPRQPSGIGHHRRFASLHRILVDQGWAEPRSSEPAKQAGGGGGVGRRKARVAFVGDGINDAPALARADISISPCSGSPIALTSSSFILMSASLASIPTLLDISTRVFRRVKFNFCWALVYNAVLVPVAAGVFFRVREDGWRLGPVWGSLAMALSSVSVVVSSLLLKWERPWPWQW